MKNKKFKVGDIIYPKEYGKRICIAISDSYAVFCPIIFKKDNSRRTVLTKTMVIDRQFKKNGNAQIDFPYSTPNGNYQFKYWGQRY